MSESISQYPFGPLPTRRILVAEVGTVEQVRERLEQLAEQAARKRNRETSVLVVPPVQSDEERGQGDSINARLHRILHGES